MLPGNSCTHSGVCVCKMSKRVCGLLESCRWMEEKKRGGINFSFLCLASTSVSMATWKPSWSLVCVCQYVSVCESVWAEPLHCSSTVGVGAAILLGLIIFNFLLQIGSERSREERRGGVRDNKRSNRF